MSNFIYGTAWKKEETSRLVEEAITCGFKSIDTACQPRHYREDLVGVGLENAYNNLDIKREDLFIQTKFTPIGGQDINNMPYLESDDVVIQLEKSFLKSKENLKTDYIDSYLIHSPFGPAEDFIRVYNTMEEFVQSGQVGQIGISNCYDFEVIEFLYDTAKVKPKVVQNRFYAQSGYDKEIRAFCKEKKITYQGFWTLTANPHLLSCEEVIKLANKYDKTVPQIFYKFLNQLGVTPLNGTTSKEHMLEDLQIDTFSLSRQEVKDIEKYLG